MRNLRATVTRLAPLALCAALAACATATPYQPRAGSGYGYTEQKLENNRFRVSFSGNSQSPRHMVEDYLLYRAAEVTLANGYDYFVLSERDTEADTRQVSTFSGFDGFGWYSWYGPGIGVATTTSSTRYEAVADIVAFRGAKPEADVKAFDAKQVKANLEARIRRPEVASN